MSTFDQYSDIIDSRDVIERTEELKTELEAFHEDQETTLSFEYAIQDAVNFPGLEAELEEYNELLKLTEEASSSADWNYGEQLINRDYFETYIEELIDECYELPEALNSGEWPYRHISIDYAAAAQEAEQDYMSVHYFGHEFLIRA